MPARSAGFALPAIGEGHPVTKHRMCKGKTAGSDAGVVGAERLSKFLDQHQVETPTALGRRIVSGSSKGQVS
jgi:hypothetical protein